jgi:hypothetical protein
MTVRPPTFPQQIVATLWPGEHAERIVCEMEEERRRDEMSH